MKLSTFFESIKKTKLGNQLKRIEVVVDYNREDDTVDEVLEVNVFVNNEYKCEISDLLDCCDGNPLNKIIEAINWREICSDAEFLAP